MKESIRCCISCILPCGALDVIRIVHASGRVEEIGGRTSVLAGEIMQAYPKHVLRKPPSSSSLDDEGCSDGPRAVVLPPNAELQRGKIYFLMPVVPSEKKSAASAPRRKKKTRKSAAQESEGHSEEQKRLLVSDRYLSEILSEKASTQRERRRGRVAVWRPHLESIDEITND